MSAVYPPYLISQYTPRDLVLRTDLELNPLEHLKGSKTKLRGGGTLIILAPVASSQAVSEHHGISIERLTDTCSHDIRV